MKFQLLLQLFLHSINYSIYVKNIGLSVSRFVRGINKFSLMREMYPTTVKLSHPSHATELFSAKLKQPKTFPFSLNVTCFAYPT